ncbi:hypothetical protein [Methylorubrum salsuginis]|uniref:Beta-barrel assembly machine subunit BamF n=1 Tax=Methylorubrum salsuginis TaxID=414703 RepID=A0A1I4GUX0_9HYPH|nr:hypothetical protein [Methylorubrum salsuginis]SFL33824.1 hypothetical protein SAMN04488125_11321 [Methylorubrum salsuginis]
MPLPPIFRAAALPRYAAAALLAASLGSCQAFSGGAGVMPETEIGPPPSARGTLPSRAVRTSQVDDDGAPLPSTPTRRLDLPKNVRGDARAADAGPRRIDRDEIEGAQSGGRSASGGLSPSVGAGGVGLGGKF